MDEVQNLADRIAVIANGRIVAQGTPETIGGRDRLNTRIRFEVPEGVSAGDLPPSASSAAEVDERAFEMSTGDPTRILSDLTGWALARGAQLEGLSWHPRALRKSILSSLAAKEQDDDG